ncbi:DUF167 domain-containing protein [Desulfoscipio gibsoniae]|uniref:UPF0235 protein Desgi_3615 n=1 Tax=Desulfoscipio gibsoniae DSM 7213 TaxID=767817 RepID=R4KIA9_9FIRM|nr:DUF167 domain-containing protein [Desulfoscipio gibsoniae]AGL02938.1 TIGR00251 family protein [Desulfoscipio gibsoniae DSM 7213]
MLDIKEDAGGVSIKIRVQPRAAKNQVSGVMEGALKVRLTAPPVDGAANKACCAFVAELLGVAKGRVAISQGHTGRNKTVRVEGLTAGQVLEKLNY